MLDKLKSSAVLNAHPVAQMPPEIARRKNIILAISIISTILMDILSFSVKGAQFALEHNYNKIAAILMIVYLVRQIISSAIQLISDNQKSDFQSGSDVYITESVSNVANTVRGKVFEKKVDHALLMTNSAVIMHMKDYIGYVWAYWQNLPFAIYHCFTAIIMAVFILVTDFLQSQDIILSLFFAVFLVLCIIAFAVLYKYRLAIKNGYRKQIRIAKTASEIQMNDIKNIEPVIKKEFTYRVGKLTKALKAQRITEKLQTSKLNLMQILRTLCLAGFMVMISVIKINYAGGFDNFSFLILTDILAISAVYSSILEKVASILEYSEKMTNTIRDAEIVQPAVDNIMHVNDVEATKNFSTIPDTIDSITVNPFEFTYQGANSIYMLRNPQEFHIKMGATIGIFGPTGSGKTTFAHIITGSTTLNHPAISFGDSFSNTFIPSIMHETNGNLGCNFVLEELILSEDVSNFDRERLLQILHGTHIYNDIQRNLGLKFENDDAVLNYLNTTTCKHYSSGQRQRLAICKILYNLSDYHQIVVFDEATNALDDATALAVLTFIRDFVHKDVKRIAFFISHQQDLTRQISTGNVNITSNNFPVFEINFDS